MMTLTPEPSSLKGCSEQLLTQPLASPGSSTCPFSKP